MKPRRVVHKGDSQYNPSSAFTCWDAKRRLKNPIFSNNWNKVNCPKCRKLGRK